jgi:hypothetical protein
VSSNVSSHPVASNFCYSNQFRTLLSFVPLSVFLSPFFSISSALFAHPDALYGQSTAFLSIVCTLFAKTWGVGGVPKHFSTPRAIPEARNWNSSTLFGIHGLLCELCASVANLFFLSWLGAELTPWPNQPTLGSGHYVRLNFLDRDTMGQKFKRTHSKS